MRAVIDSLLGHVRRMRWMRAASPWLWASARSVTLRRDVRRGVTDDFDTLYGVKTRVVHGLPQLLRTMRHGGYEHEPTPPARFRELMGALDVKREETVFVDYGSGAGRAVMLASEFPFKEVVGVELSPHLHARAEANVRAFPASRRRAASVRLVCGDVTRFALPVDPAVLYFYNPFGVPVMARVLANVDASLQAHPRPITLVLYYCFKDTRALVEAHPGFHVQHADRDVLVLSNRALA